MPKKKEVIETDVEIKKKKEWYNQDKLKCPCPIEFAKKVDEYFEWCDKQVREIETEKGIKKIYKPYTITGLSVFLGIHREILGDYGKREGYKETVEFAKARIENYVEENSLNGLLNPTVSIFNLKNNFGWKDKTEVDQNTTVSFSINDPFIEEN